MTESFMFMFFLGSIDIAFLFFEVLNHNLMTHDEMDFNNETHLNSVRWSLVYIWVSHAVLNFLCIVNGFTIFFDILIKIHSNTIPELNEFSTFSFLGKCKEFN